MTEDRAVKRLRWVMAGVIFIDLICTLCGQPASYWRKPSTAQEFNRLIRLVVIQGYAPFILSALLYIAGITFLVSVLPKRLGLMTLIAFTLGHFFGASTWLAYHFRFRMAGVELYSTVLAVVFVIFGFDTRDESSLKNKTSDDDTPKA